MSLVLFTHVYIIVIRNICTSKSDFAARRFVHYYFREFPLSLLPIPLSRAMLALSIIYSVRVVIWRSELATFFRASGRNARLMLFIPNIDRRYLTGLAVLTSILNCVQHWLLLSVENDSGTGWPWLYKTVVLLACRPFKLKSNAWISLAYSAERTLDAEEQNRCKRYLCYSPMLERNQLYSILELA